MPAPPRCSLILTRPEAKQLSHHIPTLVSLPRPLPSHHTDDAKDYYTSRTTRAKVPDDCNRLSAVTRTKHAATDERVPTRASARDAALASADPRARTYDKDGQSEPDPEAEDTSHLGTRSLEKPVGRPTETRSGLEETFSAESFPGTYELRDHF